MDERTSRPGSARRPLLSGWAPVVVWAALIFVLSAQPDLRFVPDAALDFVVRKLGHMGVFGILALLSWRALAGTTAWRRPGAWAFALAVLYAATDELHQGLVAGRHPVRARRRDRRRGRPGRPRGNRAHPVSTVLRRRGGGLVGGRAWRRSPAESVPCAPDPRAVAVEECGRSLDDHGIDIRPEC